MPTLSYCYRTAALCLKSKLRKMQTSALLVSENRSGAHKVAVYSCFIREKSSFVKHVTPETEKNDSLATRKQAATRTRTSEKENVFGDYRLAYRTKSTWELTRAVGIFLMCRFPSFADNALKMMDLCYRVLGKRLSDFLIGRTVYDQFVAGETTVEMSEAIAKLKRGGVGPILCCPTECYTEATCMSEEEFYDLNLTKVLESIDMATELEDPYPMVQYKYTAFISGDLVTRISPICEKTIHNSEVIQGVMAAMEGHCVDYTKLPGWGSFPVESTNTFTAGLRRIGQVNKELQKHEIIALTDAEYVNINPGLRLLGLCSMKQCNTGHRAKVFYTYQAYLKQTAKELAEDIQFSKAAGFRFGVKLVRGAYMVQERQRAKAGGYPDPVNDDFNATCRSYATCLDILLNEAALTCGNSAQTLDRQNPLTTSTNSLTSRVRFITASHNEDSVLYALQRMEELGIPKDGGDVFFGQLYGMADHVSFSLGSMGYSSYKSMPYGALSETLPYLSRRAQENKAILVNARRERNLILKTLRDRALLRA